MVNDYLQDMDAEIVMDNDYLGIRCVYGYSHEIKDYVYQDDKKINVNIYFLHLSLNRIGGNILVIGYLFPIQSPQRTFTFKLLPILGTQI